ncbi:2909_t:CDS:2, partial [Dentiscutata erythropus]
DIESPETWWLGYKIPNHYLQKLALHILAITLHSASCNKEENIDANYVSDTENLDDLLQFSEETLDVRF